MYSNQKHSYRDRIYDDRATKDGRTYGTDSSPDRRLECRQNSFLRGVELANWGYSVGASNIKFFCVDDNGENQAEKFIFLSGGR